MSGALPEFIWHDIAKLDFELHVRSIPCPLQKKLFGRAGKRLRNVLAVIPLGSRERCPGAVAHTDQ